MAEWRSQYCSTDNEYILFRIWVKETATNVIANTSTISIDVYAWRTNNYTTNYGGGCNVKIDGVARGYQYWSWNEKPVYYDSDTFLYSESGIVINHNANGTKSINVQATCEWYADGSIYIDSAWQGFDITLTALDRAAPTVSVSTSNVGVSSFTVSGSSNVVCDRWDYSINNGSSWTNFSTTSGTSASTTITGLSPNTTYNTKVRARKTSNQVYGTSSTTSPKTLGNAILNSVNTMTVDNSTAQIVLNATIYVPSYTHSIAIKNGNTTVLTLTGVTLSNGSNTITLTAAQRSTILTHMALIKTFTATYVLTTYSGSTQIGSSSSKTATVQTTSANSAPTFTGFTYHDNNSAVVSVTGNNQIMVQNASTVRINATAATAKNGASISSYSVSFGNLSTSSSSTTITMGTITTSGTVTMTVTAIDSRGYSTSRSTNVTVIAYSKIAFTSSTIRRVNEVENTIQLSFAGNRKAIVVGGIDKNGIMVCQYRYKKTSDSSYGSYVDILSSVTTSGLNFSFSNNALVNLDSNYSWNVQVYIQDKLTTDTLNLIVGQGIPLMAFRNKKVGINVLNPTYNLDVGGTFAVSGDIYHKGSKSTTNTIHFIDNTADAYGNGIRIGGGGCTIIGGGESASTAESGLGYTGGSEAMVIANDSNIEFYSNLQDGWASRKMMNFKSNGVLNIPAMYLSGGRANDPSGGDDEGLVIRPASNNYAGLCLGNPSGLRSVFYLNTSNANAWWRYNNGTTGYDIQHPKKAGTISLYGDSIERAAWWDSGDSHNVNDLHGAVTFAYTTHGAPATGTIVSFDCAANSSYTFQMMAGYSDQHLYYRTRNGDNGTWGPWRYPAAFTALYAGRLTNGNQTSWGNHSRYNGYVIVGSLTGSDDPLNVVIIPRYLVSTTAKRYQYADESLFTSFTIWNSGETCYVKGSSASNAQSGVMYIGAF